MEAASEGPTGIIRVPRASTVSSMLFLLQEPGVVCASLRKGQELGQEHHGGQGTAFPASLLCPAPLSLLFTASLFLPSSDLTRSYLVLFQLLKEADSSFLVLVPYSPKEASDVPRLGSRCPSTFCP